MNTVVMYGFYFRHTTHSCISMNQWTHPSPNAGIFAPVFRVTLHSYRETADSSVYTKLYAGSLVFWAYTRTKPLDHGGSYTDYAGNYCASYLSHGCRAVQSQARFGHDQLASSTERRRSESRSNACTRLLYKRAIISHVTPAYMIWMCVCCALA